MRPMDRWRSVMAAIGISVLAAGSLATGAQAADDLHATFHATYSGCVRGASNSVLGSLALLDHDTLVDYALPFIVDSHGKFEACFPTAVVASGLTLVAFRDGDAQTDSFTIPDLSVHVDRVTDVVRGRSRASHALTLRAFDCNIVTGKDCPRVVRRTVTTNASGRYTSDLTHAFDLRGLDKVSLTFTSSQGDTYEVGQIVPYLDAFMGMTFLLGEVNPNQHATFRLKRSPGGTVLSTRNVTGTPFAGHYDLTFASTMTAGRQVTADFASDARVTVPSIGMSFPVESDDQKIRTHCLANRRMAIYWEGTHGAAVRTADSHGRASVNLSSAEHDGFRLAHGSQVTTQCQTAAGDILERSVTVP